jgi:hypothetical protein
MDVFVPARLVMMLSSDHAVRFIGSRLPPYFLPCLSDSRIRKTILRDPRHCLIVGSGMRRLLNMQVKLVE